MEPLELLHYLKTTLDRYEIPYLITGSMASISYGEPRFTNDIDVVADLRFEHVDRFCSSFPAPHYSVYPNSVHEAIRLRRQFNIIHCVSGLKIDVFIPGDDDFERSRAKRGRQMRFCKGLDATFASPEDVILRKMQYFKEGGSEKHLRDIAAVLKIQGERVDRKYIEEWTDRLNVTDVWVRIVEQVG